MGQAAAKITPIGVASSRPRVPAAPAKVLQFPAGRVAAPVIAKQVASSGLLKTALKWGTTAAQLAAKLGPLAKAAARRAPYIGTALTIGQLAKGAGDLLVSNAGGYRRSARERTAKPAKADKQEITKGNIQIGPDTALTPLPVPVPRACEAGGLRRELNRNRPRKPRKSCDC